MAVDPVPFVVGDVARTCAAILAGGTAVYAFLTGLYAVRAFRHGLEDRWSAAVATLVMAGLAVLLFTDGAQLLPAPFSVGLVVVFVGAGLVTVTYTLGRYKERIERFQAMFGERLDQILERSLPEERYAEWQRMRASWTTATQDPEQRRKGPHLLLGVVVLPLYAAVGFLVLRGAWELSYQGVPIAFDSEGIANLGIVTHAEPGTWLVAGNLFTLFCLLGLLYCLVPTELLRLRYPELSYPFKSIILNRLRKRERGLFGAHYYLAAAIPLMALAVTRDRAHWDVTIFAVLSAVAVAVFADAVSALVGTRWGRRKWFHNPGKSYLGSAGGTLVAFAVAAPFVGVPVAIATAAVFLVLDILAPVPFPVSDNLLNPMALAALYLVLLPHLDPWIPYY